MRPQLPTFLAFAAAFLGQEAFAGVKIVSPKSGDKWSGGETVTIKWEADGKFPQLKDLSGYTIDLCVGSNEHILPLTTLVSGGRAVADGKTAEFQAVIPAAIGESGKHYFIRMLSVAAKGGTLISYSPRFTLSGMTGTFTPAQELANNEAQGEDVPEDEDNVAASDDGSLDSLPDGDDTITYTRQTGKTRFAPMQTQPGTKITAKETKRQYPTSSFKIFTTIGPAPQQVTTVTRSWNYKVVSKENTAAPQKFLGTRRAD